MMRITCGASRKGAALLPEWVERDARLWTVLFYGGQDTDGLHKNQSPSLKGAHPRSAMIQVEKAVCLFNSLPSMIAFEEST